MDIHVEPAQPVDIPLEVVKRDWLKARALAKDCKSNLQKARNALQTSLVAYNRTWSVYKKAKLRKEDRDHQLAFRDFDTCEKPLEFIADYLARFYPGVVLELNQTYVGIKGARVSKSGKLTRGKRMVPANIVRDPPSVWRKFIF